MLMIVLVGSYLAAAALTWLVRRYALARAVIDTPNERSLHATPTPRGGGLAVALVVLAVHGWCVARGLLPMPAGGAWAAGAGVLAALGWLDDHRPLGATLRLGVQAVVFAVVLGAMSGVTALPGPAALVALGCGVLGLVWFVNLYNFMDGSDGLAGCQAVLTALLLAVLAHAHGDRGLTLGALALAGACAGFLRFNLPPARIFLGDVGSYFIGAWLGLYACYLVLRGESLWPWLIVLAPFITDASLTLGSRILRRERWWTAHRGHAYQRLVTAGWSHGLVATVFMLLGAPLAGTAWVAFHRPQLGPWLALSAYALTVTIWRITIVLTSRRAA